eukprot:TRINITY_DN20582_c0_g1_i1.p1 TRINITY_DN20582_c0_g1~~TRINITY_DN20582_c0_g1_i1.p1  ORF type:complete len:403 (-),score=76.22 TRINITY_DN20582_c0_g1_i1:209-1417(-)
MAADEPEQKNRPEDSDFKQQRLKAWQPILTPAWVIGTFLSVGVVFLAIGIAVLITSNSVVEQSTEDYSSTTVSPCVSGPQSTGGSCLKNVSMTIEKDMDSPVYMYFELSNFYQNHRRYVKSRNDNQLMSSSDATETDQCSPIDKTNDIAYYPCGLIAWSVLNDTIYARNPVNLGEYYQNRLLVLADGQSSCTTSNGCKMVETTSNGIAWSSDRDDKFEKLTNCGGDALLNSTVTPKITQPYYTYKYYQCTAGTGSTCAIGDTSETGNTCFDHVPPAAGSSVGTAGTSQTTCYQKERCGDVSNEEFIVWMRTSGLPTFRKLHRVINTDLKKGETIQFTINDVFPVSSFSGSKKLVLSTTAWIGGKNTFLGAAYITVACICILLGIGFGVKEIMSPRKAGEENQ